MQNTQSIKICIVKLSAMGDIIHAMIALQFIKKEYPNSIIDWIVEDSFRGVLENNPDINNILPINLKSIKKNKIQIFNQIQILKEYSKNNYDIVIDAQGLLKSAIAAKIVSGSKIIGFDKSSIREGLSSLFYDETVAIEYQKNVIDRNIKVLCDSLSVSVSKSQLMSKEPFLYMKKNTINKQKNIVFVIGASKINKIYPKEKYLELAESLKEDIIVVWGNEEEYQIAQWLSLNSNFISISCKGNLDDLKETISNSKLVIGGDTGPTHMAWALNVPSITIFGNTPENRNTYVTDINKVISSSSKVNPLKLDKNDFSIQNIKVENICELAKELM